MIVYYISYKLGNKTLIDVKVIGSIFAPFFELIKESMKHSRLTNFRAPFFCIVSLAVASGFIFI